MRDRLVSRAECWERLYSWLAGAPPFLRPWHHQWLGQRELTRDLSALLPTLGGTVVDVGCGSAPYRHFLPSSTHHVGVDVFKATGVDVLVDSRSSLPFRTGSLDAVISTQMLSMVPDPDALLADINRALKPGGYLVVTVPHIYNDFAPGRDLWRWTGTGLQRVLGRHLDVLHVRRQGGVGSTLGLLLLNFVHVRLSGRLRAVRVALLPVLLLLAWAVNTVAVVLDVVDGTGRFYANLVGLARKKPQSDGATASVPDTRRRGS